MPDYLHLTSLSKTEFKKVFNPLFLRLVLFSGILIALLFVCRNFVVAAFLSGAYAGAADYMGFQLLGDFFRSAGWCFGFVLIARQETKAFLGIEVGAQLVFAVLTYVGIRLFEFQGPMMAYAFENFITLVALVIVVRRLKWNIQ